MENDDKGKGGIAELRRKFHGAPPAIALTEDQKNKVKEIFGKYDLSTLTADQAKAIYRSLDEAGISGPGLRAAVEAAGMDPQKFWSLAHEGDPRLPARPHGGRPRFPPPGSPGRRPAPRTASGKDAKKGGPNPT